MSIKYMSAILDAKTGLTATQKLILLKLADHADDDGVCWPSQERIAQSAEVCTRSVIRAVAALEAAGWITVKRCVQPCGQRETNRYTLTFPCDNLSLGDIQPCDKSDQNHVTPVSPKPSYKPPIRKSQEESPPRNTTREDIHAASQPASQDSSDGLDWMGEDGPTTRLTLPPTRSAMDLIYTEQRIATSPDAMRTWQGVLDAFGWDEVREAIGVMRGELTDQRHLVWPERVGQRMAEVRDRELEAAQRKAASGGQA